MGACGLYGAAMVRLSRRQALGCGIGALAGLPGVSARAQDPRFFRIATGPTESTFFQIGTLIGQVVSSPPGARECERGGSCGVPGLIAVSQTTSGSVANIELIKTKRIDSGLCQADIAHWAFHGSGMYRLSGAITNLRAIANLFPEIIHVVVRKGAAIANLADLRGKRVALGEQDSGIRVTARAVLDAAGLPETEFRAELIAPSRAADALREGTIDAFFEMAGPPSPVITDLATHLEVALVPIPEALIARLRDGAPFFTGTTIPADTYNGVPEAQSVSIGTLWVVQAEASEQIVQGLLRALFHQNNRRTLDQGHPLGRFIRLETALDGVALELHPGAALFYFEAGIDPAQVRRRLPP